VDAFIFSLTQTMPGCLTKSIESVRKHKLVHWDRNRETNRAWLALNMMTEGRAGFRAFHEGPKACREVDFLLLRRRLAEGHIWDDALIEEILPQHRGNPDGSAPSL
jgi:6-oxo-cyclohex-1-ene-carbonyl-CoA hydrolase